MVVWKTQLVLIVAEMMFRYFNSFEECQEATLKIIRVFEPLAYGFESALSIFWVELFLDTESTPAWLKWDILWQIVQHYDFE